VVGAEVLPRNEHPEKPKMSKALNIITDFLAELNVEVREVFISEKSV